MDVKITMLDVKDADAIIVELFKPGKTLVMVIDGGSPTSYKTVLKSKLREILENHKKNAPEIVVCTHYDSDHIGGLIPLIKQYINGIQEVWVHLTPQLLKGFIQESKRILHENKKHIIDYNLFKNPKLLETYDAGERGLLKSESKLILESLPQLERLTGLIPKEKLRPVFHKQHPLPEWDEIIVLGPTVKYFESLFPITKSLDEFLLEEALDILPSGKAPLSLLEAAGIKPCDTLKKEKETKLSPTNKASIIIAIDNDNGRYLFTGDAGIQSFKAIPKWDSELKDLFFLKIPHHASDNNISKELIEVMQPVYAYNTGFKYQSEAVLKCIKSKPRNIEVRSTKRDGNLIFDK
jgi:beta-lactamase superfamily II metal-dependent hydrolase